MCMYHIVIPSTQALLAEEAHDKEIKRIMAMNERKRPYNSMRADQSKEPTEEEMEAYHLKKRREEDPMAGFLDR